MKYLIKLLLISVSLMSADLNAMKRSLNEETSQVNEETSQDGLPKSKRLKITQPDQKKSKKINGLEMIPNDALEVVFLFMDLETGLAFAKTCIRCHELWEVACPKILYQSIENKEISLFSVLEFALNNEKIELIKKILASKHAGIPNLESEDAKDLLGLFNTSGVFEACVEKLPFTSNKAIKTEFLETVLENIDEPSEYAELSGHIAGFKLLCTHPQLSHKLFTILGWAASWPDRRANKIISIVLHDSSISQEELKKALELPDDHSEKVYIPLTKAVLNNNFDAVSMFLDCPYVKENAINYAFIKAVTLDDDRKDNDESFKVFMLLLKSSTITAETISEALEKCRDEKMRKELLAWSEAPVNENF